MVVELALVREDVSGLRHLVGHSHFYQHPLMSSCWSLAPPHHALQGFLSPSTLARQCQEATLLLETMEL
jgi:hypothetical protein